MIEFLLIIHIGFHGNYIEAGRFQRYDACLAGMVELRHQTTRFMECIPVIKEIEE